MDLVFSTPIVIVGVGATLFLKRTLRRAYGRPTYAEIRYGGRRMGDSERHHGRTVVLIHPESEWGRGRIAAQMNGWRYLGRTRIGITSPEHPGLDVYEDRTLYARWLRFRGKARDGIHERALP